MKEIHRMAPVFGRSARALLLAGAIAVPALASSAQAQERSGDAAAQHGADSQNSDSVPDIVVTAQFRGQKLQETPLAITAVSGEMLDARSVKGIADIAANAPGVTLQAGGGAGGAQTTQINIRGIGQSDFNMALEPAVGMYVDDVYQGVMFASTPELLDLERVEVLRGPQGTLSGRNSIGGAIRLISKKPSAEREAFVEASYGSYNRMNLRAGANFALVPDRLFVRLSGLAKRVDGYVDRLDYKCVTGNDPAPVSAGSQVGAGSSCKLGTEGGQSVVALRGAARLVVNDAIENTVTVDYTNDTSEPSANVLVAQGTWHGPGYNLLTSPPTLNLAQNFVLPAGSFANYANYTGLIGSAQQYTLEPRSDASVWGVSNVFDIRLSDALSIKSITAWRAINTLSTVDSDASPLNRLLQTWSVRHRQFTQELRISGKVGEIANWTVGGFYYVGHSRQSGRAGLDGASDNSVPFYVPLDFRFDDPIDVKSRAAFVHLEVRPLTDLTLTGGLRYTKDNKDYLYRRFLAPGVPVSLLSAGVLPLDNQTGRFEGSRWDWRVAADLAVTKNVHVYGQVSTGFKGGGINPRPYYVLQIRPFKPETVQAYELGLKSDLFGRMLRLNVAAYLNKYHDIQRELLSCPVYVPAGAVPNCAMPDNVGDATIKGAEVEIEAHPARGLSIDGSASYTDFRYDRVNPSTLVQIGMVPPYTPKWKAAFGVQYEVALGSRGSLTPRFDYSYQSQVHTDAINTTANIIPGRSIANARLTYRAPDRNWELSLAVTNLFDKYYFINLYERTLPTTASYQVVTGQPARPREWSLSIKHRF